MTVPTIEPKVKAATGGASAAAVVCWVLTHLVFHGALPVPVEALVDIVVPGATALLGGYFARHQDRPPATVNVPVHLNLSPAPETVAAMVQHLQGQYAVSASTPAPEDPARPAVAVQPTENPNPKENPMSLVDEFRTLVEQFRGEVVSKVGTEVVDDVHAAFDLFKGQGAKLLIEAGHDAQADASQVISNVAQVASDTAAAVTPAPVETTPAPETPADPAAPTA